MSNDLQALVSAEFTKAIDFPSIDVAIDAYIKKRDELDAERKKYNAYEREAKDELERINQWLKDKADELGLDGLKASTGTAFRKVKTSYRMGNWDEFIKWVRETGNYQCLEKRVAKLATAEIHNESGVVPPGVEYVAEVEMEVRRPSK